MRLRNRHLLRIGLVVLALFVAGGPVRAQGRMRTEKSLHDEYSDFKDPRRAPGENRWIVTICAGFPYVFDRTYSNMATNIRSDWGNLPARSHGTDGSIEILTRSQEGDGDITWDVEGVGKITLTVRVIDCHEKEKTPVDPPKVPPPPTDPRKPQPPPVTPLRGFKTPTHRTSRCARCFDVADRLNAAIDKFNETRAEIEKSRQPVTAGQNDQLSGLYSDVGRLSRELDACEKQCVGISTRTKAMIGGAAAAGATALAFAAGGGSAPAGAPAAATPAPVANVNPSPTPAPAPTPTPTPTPTPPPPTPTPTPPPPAPTPTQANPTGGYTIRLNVTSDPGRHDQYTFYSGVTRVDVQVDGTTIRITGPFPWVTVTGTYTPSTGGFTADGTGTVANISSVPVSVTGTFSGDTLTIGQVQVGPTNLPGNVAELLSGSGTKQ